MRISDEVLMAYADGELDSTAQAEVENAMAADPQIARRVAEHKALKNALRSSYDKVLEEPLPDRLLAAARGRASGPGVVVPLRPKGRVRPPSVPFWGAIAASLVVGALAWHFGTQLYPSAPVVERNGQLLAAGALDRALSNQLVRDQQTELPVQIGVSFRSRSGSYCRTFQLRDDNNLAGLACREDDKWRLELLARGESSPAGTPELRQAGSSLPPAIAQAVNQNISGEPLDAEAEAQARTSHWRAR